jgi:hypothetical protein
MYNDALVTEEDLNNLPDDIRDDRLMEGVSDFLLSEPFLSCVLGDYRDRLSAALDAAGVTGKHRENIDAVMTRTGRSHLSTPACNPSATR